MDPPLRSDEVSDLINRFPGGYWKYDIKDFVLLVNPYFPPQAFLDELKNALPRLITCYPSPNAQMVQLLADAVKTPANKLVICNGVAELIPIFLGRLGMRSQPSILMKPPPCPGGCHAFFCHRQILNSMCTATQHLRVQMASTAQS